MGALISAPCVALFSSSPNNTVIPVALPKLYTSVDPTVHQRSTPSTCLLPHPISARSSSPSSPLLLIPQTCYSRPRSVRPSTSPHTHEIDQESDRSWIMRDSERPVMRMDWCNMVKPITRLLDG